MITVKYTLVPSKLCRNIVLGRMDNYWKVQFSWRTSKKFHLAVAWYYSVIFIMWPRVRAWLGQGIFICFFYMILDFVHSKIWAHKRTFILVLMNHISKKKVENFHPQKRLNFRVGYNWQIFNFLIIFWFFVNNSPQNHPNLKYRECFEKITIRRISIIYWEMLDIKKYLGEDVFFSSSRVGDFSSKKCQWYLQDFKFLILEPEGSVDEMNASYQNETKVKVSA